MAEGRRRILVIEDDPETAGQLVDSLATNGYEVDLAVDELLKQRLHAIDPSAGWLSEETADSAHRLGVSRVWVVDPIDGTRDYLRGRPGWCLRGRWGRTG